MSEVFNGIFKAALYENDYDEEKCTIIVGNDTENYLMKFNFRNTKENITEKFSVKIEELNDDLFNDLMFKAIFLPKEIIKTNIEFNKLNSDNLKYFAINSVISINNGNVFFFDNNLMNSDSIQLKNSLSMNVNNFKKYINELYKENFEEFTFTNNKTLKNNIKILSKIDIKEPEKNTIKKEISK